uniref:G protein gamma domain-containing protein n=1 Tax=Timema monikensis TaxID=170555 RepID=A0A7R9E3Y5_9NEOP|nr:unnamed protein product [Timema monikensis]
MDMMISNLQQQRQVTEQLRREAAIKRINVSQAVLDIMKFISEHEQEDCLQGWDCIRPYKVGTVHGPARSGLYKALQGWDCTRPYKVGTVQGPARSGLYKALQDQPVCRLYQHMSPAFLLEQVSVSYHIESNPSHPP